MALYNTLDQVSNLQCCWYLVSPHGQAEYGRGEGDLSAVRNSLPLVVSRQLVYGHFVYDTSSTDISSSMTFVAEIEAGVMKRKLCQQKLNKCKEFFLTRSGIDENKRL